MSTSAESALIGQNYGIRSIPTLLIFKDGAEVGRTVGAKPKGDLARWISAQTATA